jgi:methionyl-tRNA formyltransferase
MTAPLRIAFAGSGAFGLPTLERLAGLGEIVLAISAPPRPAGRGLASTPTPIAAAAAAMGLPLLETPNLNEAASLARLRQASPQVLVVIAFGQKLSPEVVATAFSINLHASLLPKYRGAAPIARAIMGGEEETGVCVISIAERMDAGAIHAVRRTPIDPLETAGELHDRLAALGPEAVEETIRAWQRGALPVLPQDESRATRAPKIGRGDAVVDFAGSATDLRGWIHGLSPRPGCTIRLGEGRGAGSLRLLRVAADRTLAAGPPGSIDADGTIACGVGSLRLLEVQPAGGRAMPWAAWRQGHPIPPGTIALSP